MPTIMVNDRLVEGSGIRLAMMVKGCVRTPAPADIIYSPMQLAIQLTRVLAERGHHLDFYGPVGSEVPGARVIDCGVPPLISDKDGFTEALTDPGLASDNILALWDARLAQEMFLRAGRGEYDVLYFHHPEVPLPFLAHHPDVPVVSSVYDSPLHVRERFSVHQMVDGYQAALATAIALASSRE